MGEVGEDRCRWWEWVYMMRAGRGCEVLVLSVGCGRIARESYFVARD